MPKLHTTDDILSLRHAPSWLMLCFAAGSINGIAFTACQRYVTHVTGTVTKLGLEIMRWSLLLDFVLVLVCFIAGAMLSGLLIQGRAHRNERPYFSLPLWIASLATIGIAVAGHFGWLGAFGGEVDEPGDFVFLCVLSFAMGLQNAAVATSTGQLVRTTHLTGPATDLGVSLAELCFASGEALDSARRHAALRAGKIFAYATGAAVALPVAANYQFLSLILPAAVMSVATALSIAHKEVQLAMADRQPGAASQAANVSRSR